jgi:WD40 repeat protein
VLGVSFKTIMKEWEAGTRASMKDRTLRNLRLSDKTQCEQKADRVYDRLKISPDGEHLAYTSNDKGLYKVFLYDNRTGKQKKIFRKGIRLDEKVDYSYPLLAWHPTGQVLAMITEWKGLVYLYFYDLETRKWTSQNIFGYQKTLTSGYSPTVVPWFFSHPERSVGSYTYTT